MQFLIKLCVPYHDRCIYSYIEINKGTGILAVTLNNDKCNLAGDIMWILSYKACNVAI